MEVPKNLKRLKPNQVVVLDRYYLLDDDNFKANAIAISENGELMMFDTEAYHTDGKVEFYGES